MRISERIFNRLCKEYEGAQNSVIFYNFLPKLISMFEWEGLPDSIPHDYLEFYLHTGYCGIHKSKDGSKWIATDGTIGGSPDEYGRGNTYNFAVPEYSGEYKIDGLSGDGIEIGQNCIFNFSLFPYILHICKILEKADSNLATALTTSDLTDIWEVDTDADKKQIERLIEQRKKGESSIFVRGKNNELQEFLNTQKEPALREYIPSAKGDATYIPMILQAYDDLFARLCREVGINIANKMKKAQVQESELNGYENYSQVLIHSMYLARKDFAERVNAMTGLNISVEVSEAFREDPAEEIASEEPEKEQSEEQSEEPSKEQSEGGEGDE